MVINRGHISRGDSGAGRNLNSRQPLVFPELKISWIVYRDRKREICVRKTKQYKKESLREPNRQGNM
jgi:hypothetical protein